MSEFEPTVVFLGDPALPAEAHALIEEHGTLRVFREEMQVASDVVIDGAPYGWMLTGGHDDESRDVDVVWELVPLGFREHGTELFSITYDQDEWIGGTARDTATAVAWAGVVITRVDATQEWTNIETSAASGPLSAVMKWTADLVCSVATAEPGCPVCKVDGEGWGLYLNAPAADQAAITLCLDAFWTRCADHHSVVPGDDDGLPALVDGAAWQRRNGVWGPVD